MPVTPPPDIVLRELLGPTTRHTRRVEIYEANGIDRWAKDTALRLKDGSVSVDYTRDERRALDLTLANDDNVLLSAPGQFWYDKIVKVFRGVQVREQQREPKIIIISDDPANDTAVAFRTMLSLIGYGDVRVAPLAASLVDLIGYDIVVSLSPNSSSKNTLLKNAYAAGYRILTIGGGNAATWTAAFFGTSATDVSIGNSFTIAPRAIVHPTALGWSAFAYNSGMAAVNVVNSASFTNADITPVSLGASNAVNAMAISNGTKRWFMVNHTAYNGLYSIDQFRNMMISAMAWLNPVAAIDTWEVQIGEFMIDAISEDNFPYEVKITGRDYTKKCLASKYVQATQFASGQTLEALIGAIATAAGITKRILPVTGITIGRTFFFERGVDRWAAMKEITNAYNYEIFFDAQGYLVIRPYSDPVSTPPVIYVETGSEGTLAKFSKATTDTRIYNHVVVTGESSDSTVIPVWAEAKNTNSLSPTRIAAIGDRTFFYTSSFITTEAQAQAVADSFLAVHALEDFQLSFESLMFPWLEVGDILGFIDPRPAPDDPTTFLLSALTIPLGLSPMSGVGKRVSLISALLAPKLLATFSGGNTAAGTVPAADTGQAFTQAIIGGSGLSGWRVTNGTVGEINNSNESFITANAGISDGTFSATIASLNVPVSESIGLVARMANATSTTCLLLQVSMTGVYEVYKRVAGAYTLIGSLGSRTARVGDIMKFTINGTAVTASAGGAWINFIDSTGLGGTYFGLRSTGAITGKTGLFDNLKAVGL